MTIQTVAGTGVFPASLAGMSPANRVRTIVAVLAAVAAGIVAGVVYATRQDPPQPVAQCKGHPKPFVVPGTVTSNLPKVRSALTRSPRDAVTELELLAQQA